MRRIESFIMNRREYKKKGICNAYLTIHPGHLKQIHFIQLAANIILLFKLEIIINFDKL